MKRNALWVVALALAAGLIAAGCGDDDDGGGDDGGGEALSKEDYLAQANQICEDGNAEVEAAFEELGADGQPSQEEIEAVVTDTLVPSGKDQVEELREGVPEADQETVNAMLDEADQLFDDIESDPSILTEAAASGEDPFADLNQRLNDYGLTGCAS